MKKQLNKCFFICIIPGILILDFIIAIIFWKQSGKKWKEYYQFDLIKKWLKEIYFEFFSKKR